MAIPEQTAQVVEMDLDQSRAREQLPDAAQAFDQEFAGQAENFQGAGIVIMQLENFLGRQADDAIGGGFQLFETLQRLGRGQGWPK